MGVALFARMPAGNGLLLGHKKSDWNFPKWSVFRKKGLNGASLSFPRSLGLGGSSLLNGMIYLRGNPADYDQWADRGIKDWSHAAVLPYFKRSTGPITLSPSRHHTRLSRRGSF